MTTKKTPISHICIVGGGTAAWMAANLMAKCWIPLGIKISLIESPDIGIIGVGEGSTPQLKTFFDFLSIDEKTWMPECNATYKNGITFKNWSTMPGCNSYFHSFESEVDFKTEPAFIYNCAVRRKGVDVHAHPDDFYLGSTLTQQKRTPLSSENFPFRVGYGYHFDSGLLGKFLGKHAESLGVQHISAKVTDIALKEDGNISHVTLDSGEDIHADLFVDSTGFRSLLLQQKLGVGFKEYKENLFNDSAVTMPTPTEKAYEPHTTSTALSCGWAWRIPLTSRVGNGYVYSSQYCTAEEAEKELREHLGVGDDVEARHLKMRVGRVEKHWHKNCLAIGLSQGFIEPLEATALHIVQETIQGFIDAYELGRFTTSNQDSFNKRINDRFEGVRDYIVTHYILNSRHDTQYWKDNRAHTHLSDTLKHIINCWQRGEDLSKLVRDTGADKYYTSMSWHSIFSGYGIYPNKLMPGSEKAHRHNLNDIQSFLTRCAMNFKETAES